jgi:hypothetical protein
MVAVDLGRGGDEHALAEPGAVLEDSLGALDVRQQRAAGLLDDQANADRRSEVEDDVAPVHQLAHDRAREHGLHDEVESGPVTELGHVVGRAGREVVEGEYLPPILEQQLREM